jgi:hypothetical protein
MWVLLTSKLKQPWIQSTLSIISWWIKQQMNLVQIRNLIRIEGRLHYLQNQKWKSRFHITPMKIWQNWNIRLTTKLKILGTTRIEKIMINMMILMLYKRIKVEQERFLRHWELNNSQYKYLRKFKKTLTKI